MRRVVVRASDLKVRMIGIGLLLLATAMLALLPAHHGARAPQPSVAELCMAFVAVCSASVGASFLFVGGRMFEPVPAPRGRAEPDRDMLRGER